MSIRHNAEAFLANEERWYPLNLGAGGEGELRLRLSLTGLSEPFGTTIRKNLLENNVPVNQAAYGVHGRQSAIRREARKQARISAQRRETWRRTTDGYDIPVPPGCWLKQNQFPGRWRLMYACQDDTQYINIAAMYSHSKDDNASLEELSKVVGGPPVVDAKATLLGFPAVKMESDSSLVYFVDVGSRPLFWVFYLSVWPKEPRKNGPLEAFAAMTTSSDPLIRFKPLLISELPKPKFTFHTQECSLETPPLWWVDFEPHFAVLYSPVCKTSIDSRRSQQTNKTEKIRISRPTQSTAAEAAAAAVAEQKTAQGRPTTFTVEAPQEFSVDNTSLKYTFVQWNQEGEYHHKSFFTELRPGVVLSLKYTFYTPHCDKDVPSILASVRAL